MLRFLVLTIFCASAAMLAACGGDSGPKATSTPAGTATAAVKPLPRISLDYGAGNLLAEVAITADESALGLGYRDSLFERGGMLFDLHSTTVPSFWMKGMRFPLDMIWIGEDKKVVSITANIPPEPGVPDEQLKRYAPDTPVRWVLEVNGGAAAAFGITPGSQMAFEIPPALLGSPVPTTRAGATPSGLPPTPVIGAPQP